MEEFKPVYIIPGEDFYHTKSCKWAQNRYAEQATIEEALSLGLWPCKQCLREQYYKKVEEYNEALREEEKKRKREKIVSVFAVLIVLLFSIFLYFTRIQNPLPKATPVLITSKTYKIFWEKPSGKTNGIGDDWYVSELKINGVSYSKGDTITLSANSTIKVKVTIYEKDTKEKYNDVGSKEVSFGITQENINSNVPYLTIYGIEVTEDDGGTGIGKTAIMNVKINFVAQ